MTNKEFQELVLDEQRKWGGSPGMVLIESREFVKLPKSEGKSEPVKKADPLAKISDTLYARLVYGRVDEIPPTAYAQLIEGGTPATIPDGIHQRLVEALEGKGAVLPEDIHYRMLRAFDR
jgi:hypothetical protein